VVKVHTFITLTLDGIVWPALTISCSSPLNFLTIGTLYIRGYVNPKVAPDFVVPTESQTPLNTVTRFLTELSAHIKSNGCIASNGEKGLFGYINFVFFTTNREGYVILVLLNYGVLTAENIKSNNKGKRR
jgi:hypothetical protein